MEDRQKKNAENDETRELNQDKLDNVSGGDLPWDSAITFDFKKIKEDLKSPQGISNYPIPK